MSGIQMSDYLKSNGYETLPTNPTDIARGKIAAFMEGDGSEKHAVIRETLQENMTRHVGVFREKSGLLKMMEMVKELQQRFLKIKIEDQKNAFNLDLIETFEVGNLLSFSEVIVAGAQAREESRGAHYRTDFPKRDDNNWLVHTLGWRAGDGIRLDHTKKVNIDYDRYPPKERKY